MERCTKIQPLRQKKPKALYTSELIKILSHRLHLNILHYGGEIMEKENIMISLEDSTDLMEEFREK